MFYNFLQFEFLQNAFLSGALIGIAAPLLGVFVVVRRLSLIADALSHVTLAGIAAGLLLSSKIQALATISPIYLGMGFSVLGSLLIEKLRTVYKHYEELAIPILLSAGIGLSVVFISLADGLNTDLFSYLFGSVSAVSRIDLYVIFFVSVFALLVIVLFLKEMFLLSFDEEYATASGLPAKALHLLFILTVALVISVAMRVVGILLVSSLMTLPVAASIRIAKGFKQTMFASVLIGEFSVLFGLFLSYYLDIAPGGTIVILNIIILLLAIFWSKTRGRTI